MPDRNLISQFSEAQTRYLEAVDTIVPLLVRMTLASLDEVLPGTHQIEAVGRLTEDWIRTLRIQRILGQDGTVLFDLPTGHVDRAVEDAVDQVNAEYLDFLLDLTGDTYMGHVVIDLTDADRA